mmetsp:Transcript_43173/g.101482  ORF Transcript_43173/g.101482 Transcript_43173/m.101482 type:complete len:568 (-) Transcript_43173:112-1815(-)
MDPFKVLQIPRRPVNNQADLDQVRAKAKKLFKRYGAEKNKFEAKKVMEAFEMIRREMKQAHVKILGRSRKERELDKHFNHQSKEIKKNKDLRRMLRHEAKGGKRMHLRGDKERIAAPKKKKRKRVAGPKATQEMNVLRALGRVAPYLKDPVKFPKAMALLYKWIKDCMSMDNFEHVFLVLQDVVNSPLVVSEADGRQEVIKVFNYVLNYFESWFGEAEERQTMEKHWRVGTLLACQCFTDDAFTLSSTISNLNKVMDFLRERKPLLEAAEAELAAGPSTRRVLKQEEGGEPDSKKLKTAKEEDEDEDGDDSEAKDMVKEEMEDDDEEEEEEAKGFGKLAKDEDAADEHVDKKLKLETVKKEDPDLGRTCSRQSLMSAASNVTSIDLDDDDEKSEISSGESAPPVEEIDDGSSDDVGVLEEEIEISLGDSSSDDGEAEEVIFPMPSAKKSLLHLREKFVDRCLATLFQQRGPLWAKPKIDAFFQDVYYKKDMLSLEQQERVEAWQARIKVMQREGERAVGEANNPMEAQRPVIDSRETLTLFDADAGAWAAKQTFDARDRFGGSKTLR